jgi:heptosyltransferase II
MGYKTYQTRLQTKRKAIIYYLIDLLTSLVIKSKPVEIKSPKNILIIRNDHIGDVVLCSQVFREIKRKYPSSKITALVSPISKSLLEKNPHVDKILSLDLFWRNKRPKSLMNYFRILNKIRDEKFDVGIDIRGSLMNIIFLLWLPGIRKRVSYFNASGGKSFLTNPIKYERLEHTIKFDADLVAKGLDFKIKNYWPEIITDKSDENSVNKFLKENGLKKYICICPGATNLGKQWPVERFDALIKRLNTKLRDHVIILCGASSDSKIIDYLSKNKNTLPLMNFNLRLLSLLFKKSQMVIANDGGALHIAWVSGAKVLALWGPIDLVSIMPLGKSRIIHHQDKIKTTKNLMDLIMVDEVERECHRLIRDNLRDVIPREIQ